MTTQKTRLILICNYITINKKKIFQDATVLNNFSISSHRGSQERKNNNRWICSQNPQVFQTEIEEVVNAQ